MILSFAVPYYFASCDFVGIRFNSPIVQPTPEFLNQTDCILNITGFIKVHLFRTQKYLLTDMTLYNIMQRSGP